jgi:hypothetical protein
MRKWRDPTRSRARPVVVNRREGLRGSECATWLDVCPSLSTVGVEQHSNWLCTHRLARRVLSARSWFLVLETFVAPGPLVSVPLRRTFLAAARTGCCGGWSRRQHAGERHGTAGATTSGAYTSGGRSRRWCRGKLCSSSNPYQSGRGLRDRKAPLAVVLSPSGARYSVEQWRSRLRGTSTQLAFRREVEKDAGPSPSRTRYSALIPIEERSSRSFSRTGSGYCSERL